MTNEEKEHKLSITQITNINEKGNIIADIKGLQK